MDYFCKDCGVEFTIVVKRVAVEAKRQEDVLLCPICGYPLEQRLRGLR